MREKIAIQTKCGVRFSPKWSPEDSEWPMTPDLSVQHVVRSAEGILKRMNIDRIDILLLHLPDPLMKPQEAALAFADLHRAGKVRYFGLSNHRQPQIELLRKYVRQPLVAHQFMLGLGNYYPAVDMIDYCQLHDIQVQAYSPMTVRAKTLAQFFKGRLLNPPAEASPGLKQITQALADLARQKDANPSAIALAWLLNHPASIVPIIGTSNPKYMQENCVADRVVLTNDEWRHLAKLASGIQTE